MWEILPDLFLGDRGDACDRERLRRRGITHIVTCSKELPCHFPADFEYLWLRMDDPDPSFEAKIPTFCAFIDAGRDRGQGLVHCTGGVSRSPAVILAYPCKLEGTLEKAVECQRSAEYQEASAFRKGGAGEVELVIVEGGDATK